MERFNIHNATTITIHEKHLTTIHNIHNYNYISWKDLINKMQLQLQFMNNI